jgi:hypothetical protein
MGLSRYDLKQQIHSLFPTPYSLLEKNMKRVILIFLTLFAVSGLSAQMTVSGIFDSSVSFRAGAGSAPGFSCGIEEYANVRFQARLNDRAAFFSAVNLLAAAGDYALAAIAVNPGGFVVGENYIAGIELERLYFRLSGEYTDFDGGLLRIPFGYSQVWGSSDFLNPKNPLKPDARPRAVLGSSLSWYPADEIKILGFGAAGRNPFANEGQGGYIGISGDKHWDKASVQALYSFETPVRRTTVYSSKYGIHRAGLSVKLDLEAGFLIDVLYSYNHEAGTKEDGLSFSAGADYSFLDGKLIVLAEYLCNGKTSSTALGYGGSFTNNHYLYSALTWRITDYTNATAALISCFDDVSFTPIITVNHELFQGVTLIITAAAPMDRDLFSGDGNRGELGPIPPSSASGRYFDISAKLRLRF